MHAYCSFDQVSIRIAKHTPLTSVTIPLQRASPTTRLLANLLPIYFNEILRPHGEMGTASYLMHGMELSGLS